MGTEKENLYKFEGLEHTYTDGKKIRGMINPDRERFNIIDENTPGANSSNTVEINGKTYHYFSTDESTRDANTTSYVKINGKTYACNSTETGNKLIESAVELDKQAGIRNADNSTKKEIKEIANEVTTGKNIDTRAKSGVNEKVKIKATTRKNANVFTISSDDFDLSKPVGKYTSEDKKKINELHSAWKSKQGRNP